MSGTTFSSSCLLPASLASRALASPSVLTHSRALLRASSLALEELRDLISSLRSPRYAVILRALAGGRAPWAAIRRRLEDYEGRGLNPATVSQLIGTLVKLGVVEEVNGEYAIADPVYRLAASRL
ncbi:MAG: hypothetical protein RXO24_10000 [Acidilobus sp.]